MEKMEAKTTPVAGYDFNEGHAYESAIKHLLSTGIQSTQMGKAVEILNQIIDHRKN